MARQRSPVRLLLDTSAVVHLLHGHTLHKAAVRDGVAGGQVLVPVFVRMEYLRGVVVNLIEMWCLIRESVTVEDAFIDWSQKMRQERKLKVILMTVPRWLASQDDSRSRGVTLRRLGVLVLGLIRDFDQTFPPPHDDPLSCQLGGLSVPAESYDDDHILDFYQRFKAVQEGVPQCRLCGFRRDQRQRLRRRKIDLVGDEARRRHAGNPGFLRQADVLGEADSTKETTPGCRWCERLGDSLIALQAGRGARIVTADRTFSALGDLLGVPVILLPSLAELKRQASSGAEVAGESRPPSPPPASVSSKQH
jgi:predicted nucleic acid-binding protein